jgi:hypothetical protein
MTNYCEWIHIRQGVWRKKFNGKREMAQKRGGSNQAIELNVLVLISLCAQQPVA